MKNIVILTMALFLSFQAQAKEIVLSEDNTLILDGAVTGTSVSKLTEDATKLNANLKSGYPIYLFLNTPGGSIQAGLELIEFIKGLNRPVHTISLFSASMGWQIAQHLGDRYILKYGVLMSHKARGSFRGDFGGGLSQLDARYGLWLRRIDLMDKITVKRTGGKQTLSSYRSSYAHELWLNGSEAVERGYADEVVTVKCDSTMNTTSEKNADMGFFSIKAVFSKCPLKTSPVSISASLFTNKGKMELNEFLTANGKFGKNCRAKEEFAYKNGSSYYSSLDDEAEKVIGPELCASDGTLTLEKIKKEMTEKKAFHSRNLKDYIVYSY